MSGKGVDMRALSARFAQATREISLAETIATAADLLAGKIRGRVVIRLPGL